MTDQTDSNPLVRVILELSEGMNLILRSDTAPYLVLRGYEHSFSDLPDVLAFIRNLDLEMRSALTGLVRKLRDHERVLEASVAMLEISGPVLATAAGQELLDIQRAEIALIQQSCDAHAMIFRAINSSLVDLKTITTLDEKIEAMTAEANQREWQYDALLHAIRAIEVSLAVPMSNLSKTRLQLVMNNVREAIAKIPEDALPAVEEPAEAGAPPERQLDFMPAGDDARS